MKLLYESAVRDESGLLLFKSRFKAVGRRMGYREHKLDNMELVCKEIITNQIKHAKGSGMIQLWESQGHCPSLDFFALDYGPGIEDLEHAKKDGVTTTGTMGRGLGAIERLSCESSIYTVAKDDHTDNLWHGTAIWSRFNVEKAKIKPKIQYGVYLRSLRDNFYNGDCVHVHSDASSFRWIHLDGLGHGKEAHDAILPAHKILDIDVDLGERMSILSQRLSGGRGAVGILGEIDADNEQIKISSVGDMSTYIISNGEKRTLSTSSGILGHDHRSVEISEQPLLQQALVITSSDGIKSGWGLTTLPQLWRLHPQMIALVMGQILGRNNDDRSLVVIRKAQ